MPSWRFEIVDMTTAEGDPRFMVWDDVAGHYLPGYWASEAEARESAEAIFGRDQVKN